MSEFPRVWVLLGDRKGDNNQLLALAQALGGPFETRSIDYNWLRKLPKRLLGARLDSVMPRSRRSLRPPWPDVVLGVGHRSVPVSRWIRIQSGGRTKLIQLGNPRIHPDLFDLVVTTPQYGLDESPRVLRLPFAMGTPRSAAAPTDAEREYFAALDRPHRLFVIGGPNRHWHIPADHAAAMARKLIARANESGGTLIAIGSPRTEPDVCDAVEKVFVGTGHRFIRGPMPSYFALLQDADEIHVTADSVSMLSEAIFSGKPVGMVPIVMSARGRRSHAMSARGWTKPPLPNLPAVWRTLDEQGLVGTIDEPRSAKVQNPIHRAADAVRAVLARKA